MRRGVWIIGAIGLGVAALGWMLDPTAFAYAWVAAVATWLGWPLGSLALLFVHVLTGGRWGQVLRPALLAGIGTLPLLPFALVPIAVLAGRLYPWLHAEAAAQLPNVFYLNVPFALARWTLFQVVWFALGGLALLGVHRGGPTQAVAVAGLILLGLTVTFAAYDLLLSLEPHFTSSEFGMIVGAQDVLLALSLAIGMIVQVPPGARSAISRATRRAITDSVVADLGQLLLGLLVLWAYLDFMQLLIVWQSDLPHEASWYVHRIAGPWGVLAALLALGHFLLPFAALLSPALRRSAHGILGVVVLLLVMSVLRGWWLVLPAGGYAPGWIGVAAGVGLGGISAGLALRSADMALASPRYV